MIIEEEDYVIKPCSSANCRFDVSILRTVKGKSGDRDQMEVTAYGVPFTRAIEIVAENRVQRDIKGPVDIVEYGNAYTAVMRVIVDRVESLLNQIKNAEKEKLDESSPVQEMQKGDKTHSE